MNNLVTSKTIWALGGLALLLVAVAPAGAQITQLRVSVPFPFLAGDAQLPAGEYAIKFDQFSSPRIVLENRDGHGAAILAVTGQRTEHPQAETARGRLVFERFGETYVLRRVARPNNAVVSELSYGKKARELARLHPAGDAETVTIE